MHAYYIPALACTEGSCVLDGTDILQLPEMEVVRVALSRVAHRRHVFRRERCNLAMAEVVSVCRRGEVTRRFRKWGREA